MSTEPGSSMARSVAEALVAEETGAAPPAAHAPPRQAKSDDDFFARAHAATQRVAASATTTQTATPQQTLIVQELAQDRPTIHAAVTSFLSLVAARSLVAPDPSQSCAVPQPPLSLSNAQALQCSRALLKAINGTTLCATSRGKSSEEYDLVAQLWNGLIASEQKPARYLGRRALKHAWTDVEKLTGEEKLGPFVEEFERLLFLRPPPEQDNDAALIWDQDGGKAELQRRRERRERRAKEAASQEEEEQKVPFIEELPEGNQEEPVAMSSSSG